MNVFLTYDLWFIIYDMIMCSNEYELAKVRHLRYKNTSFVILTTLLGCFLHSFAQHFKVAQTNGRRFFQEKEYFVPVDVIFVERFPSKLSREIFGNVRRTLGIVHPEACNVFACNSITAAGKV